MKTADARNILGADLVCLEDLALALGRPAGAFDAGTRAAAAEIPLGRDELVAARQRGEMLIFRVSMDGEDPLTIRRFIERFPAAFNAKALSAVGYLLRDEWGIAAEPLANTEICASGWHLARKDIVPASRNITYHDQESVLAGYDRARVYRRRTAIEAVYDLVVYSACREVKLLGDTFDWTSSRTVDNGFLNVGGFGSSGITLFGFSPPVRHNDLGVCPTCVVR